MSKSKSILLLLLLTLVQFGARDSVSCSVPVFRYALERWKPDVYKGIYLHKGELTGKDKAFLQQLEDAALNSEYPLNLRIRPVEAGEFDRERLRSILKGPEPERLPVLAIWYPDQMGKAAPLWYVEPTAENAKALTSSPKRQDLAEKLIGGASVVWVFIPSGNTEKDSQARTVLRRQLDIGLGSLAKMNFFTTAGTREKKLSYEFPVLTLSRADPEEKFFTELLMRSESDLHEHTNEPMVFPVFGRGRILGCLFGEFITEDKIQDAVAFLAASCSCEVKALNPGTDLLLAAQWDRVLMGELYADDEEPLPELTGVMPGKSAPAKTGEAASPPEPAKRKSVLTYSGIVLSSALVVVVFASLILNCRRRKE